MINVRLIYEQIEAAKAYLQNRSILNFRLALILLDNVAELLMHQTLETQFGLDDSFKPGWEPALSEWLSRRKYTPAERKEAEREFEPKTRILLLRLKKISNDDYIILNSCHKLRCEAFHSGTLRDRILEEVSKVLFMTVVELTLKLPLQGYTFPNPPLSPEDASFFERFGFKYNDVLISDQARKQFVDRLIVDVSFSNPSFTEALSNDLVERIDHLIEGLEYVSETEERSKIDHNLQYAQFWRQVGSNLRAEGVHEPELEIAYRKWQAEGHAKYTLYKIDRWRRQAIAIGRSRQPARAVAHYSGIDKRLRCLELEVAEAAFKYDEYVNGQIEHQKIIESLNRQGK